MNRVERSKNKLERLQNEQTQAFNRGKEEFSAIPFGQPNIIGRSNIYKKGQQAYDKAHKLQKEIDKQHDMIEKWENVEQFKNDNELVKDVHVVGKSRYATIGAKTSVNNLDYFKQKLTDLEKANEEAKEFNKLARKNNTTRAKTYGAEITKLKNKMANLEAMQERAKSVQISEKSQKLIDSGAVTQWKKKPIYYFVKGLKKVALILNDEGDFVDKGRYSTWSTEDKKFVEELLK